MSWFRSWLTKHWVLMVCASAGALAVVISAGGFPWVRFPAEEINIRVCPDQVQVEGIYHYRNPWPVPLVQGLSIPLPMDERHPSPWMIQAEQITPRSKELALRYFWGRHRFNVLLPASGEATVRVIYRQYAPDQDARYILTTTQPWRRPLDRGIYRLKLEGVELARSNYPLTTAQPGVAEFTRTHFMPSEDWRFAWKGRP